MFTSDRPRNHHYAFAHRGLRAIVVRPEIDIVAAAQSKRLDEALVGVWQAIGSEQAESERIDPKGLHGELAETSGVPTVLVTMPRAEHVTEAHFVAIVCPADGARRYYVLEHSWTVNDEPVTVLGQWTDDGHLNLGDGPRPFAHLFLQRIADLESPKR